MIDLETNREIFNFLNPKANDLISKMNSQELREFLNLLNNFYLEYRNILELDQNITFGLEIEYENAKKSLIKTNINKLFADHSWIIKLDGSLKDGEEINSPILRDTEKTWNDLKEVCDIVNKYAEIGEKAGGHIHVGAQILGKNYQAWKNFIKLWSVYENIIFRFTNGEYLTTRPLANKYCRVLAKKLWANYKEINSLNLNCCELFDIMTIVNSSRNQAVNFNCVSLYHSNEVLEKNTIEFRCPNGTLNPIIWQNNVNMVIRLLEYSKSNNFDEDTLNKRHLITNDYYDSLALYNEIYIDEALEFCDLIFSNNLEKIYFLRQYFKSFETSTKTLKRAQNFTM